MNTLELMGRLRRYPVFDIEILTSVTGLEPPAARVRAHRMMVGGLIYRLERNVYTVHRDPLIVASRLIWPSYISLWYAFSHHGLTLQVPHEISVLTTRRTSRPGLDFMGTSIRFITIAPRHLYGFEKIRVEEIDVFMATPEKAMVDALMLNRVSASEVFEMLREHRDELDIERMVEYVVRAGNGAVAKRMGYMLESVGHDAFDQLGGMVYRTVVPLDNTLPGHGETERRWGLVLNVGVIG